jgi:ATP phosphoribosyltransferase
MTTKDDGGPAFPVAQSQWSSDAQERVIVATDYGMTLRDYFAAKAMQGLILNSQGTQGYDFALIQSTGAELAYEFADAMLKARAL